MAWWMWWIVGGIGAAALYIIVLITYLSAKRIEVLQERVDQIDSDLFAIVQGERPYRLLDQVEREVEMDKELEREFGPDPYWSA